MGKILICLLLAAIAVFLYFKGKVNVKSKNSQRQDDPLPGVPDIVGRPKLGGRPVLLTDATETKVAYNDVITTNFDNLQKRERQFPIPQEEPDDTVIGWEDEEEELSGYANNAAYSFEDGLATGVTYEELANMGKLIKRREHGISEKETAVSIASKIDGTELMQLLESAVGDASKRIAQLLDRNEPTEANSGSSSLRNDDDGNNFNIGDYV